MKDEDLELLRLLKVFGEWARPMDIGGGAGSKHSRVLAKLCRKGLAERQLRSIMAFNSRGSYVYRITDAGRYALAQAKEGGDVPA